MLQIQWQGWAGSASLDGMSGDVATLLREAIVTLARERGTSSSICPSDAARAVGGDDWRDLMDRARDTARELARSGDVEITQHGEVLDPDATWRGPVRIRAR
ncbi:MAG: hypothetical protein NVS4B6_17240 [Mycobacterium sp.]